VTLAVFFSSCLRGEKNRRYRRFVVTAPFLRIFRFCDPRSAVCGFKAGRFLRAARFSFLRSALSAIPVVFRKTPPGAICREYPKYPIYGRSASSKAASCYT